MLELRGCVKVSQLSGGYVDPDMVDEFVENYFPELNEETKVLVIKGLNSNNERLKSD